MSWHKVAELISQRNIAPPANQESSIEYSIWGRGAGLVSQVPCLSDAIVVVGVIKKSKGVLILFKQLIVSNLRDGHESGSGAAGRVDAVEQVVDGRNHGGVVLHLRKIQGSVLANQVCPDRAFCFFRNGLFHILDLFLRLRGE